MPKAVSIEEENARQAEQALRLYGETVSPDEARRALEALDTIHEAKSWAEGGRVTRKHQRIGERYMQRRARSAILAVYAKTLGFTEQFSPAGAESQAYYALLDLSRA